MITFHAVSCLRLASHIFSSVLQLVLLALTVTYHNPMFCDYTVCIEHGGAANDERQDLINSFSDSLEVNLDDNLQGIVAVCH